MRVASVNISDYGSTGRIMLQLSEAARHAGHDSVTYSRNWWGHADTKGHCYFGCRSEHLLHHALGFITGREGSFSFFSTEALIKQLIAFGPDILHLHNLHGWYINLSLLFDYIKKYRVNVVWTLHDCWPFTGHCPYFDYAGCDKWIKGCSDCPLYRQYPESLTDNSARMYEKKKSCFTGIENIVIVCPSQWLADLVKKSFLGNYDVKVIHNGIDTSVFCNTPSTFRADHGIKEEEKMILGVASGWEERKGIDVFFSLGSKLGCKYKIVLVGTDTETAGRIENTDAFMTIGRTSDQRKLAEIYSAADVFVNPTREDNYPTVNLEAISCGTPVVSFETGGSPESVLPGCGVTVPKDDIAAMADAIIRICDDGSYSEACAESASAFSVDSMAKEYITLYEEVCSR